MLITEHDRLIIPERHDGTTGRRAEQENMSAPCNRSKYLVESVKVVKALQFSVQEVLRRKISLR